MAEAQARVPLAQRIGRWLPEGIPLPEDQWARRHKAILTVLWLHVPALVVYALVMGKTLAHSVGEGSVVASLAFFGTQASMGGRRFRAIATAAGLVASSAVLVHLSGGVTEMHFHFFVVVGIITLYQDWTVFLTAILFVALHHGIMGAIAPRQVYDHASAWNNPWKWAGIHAAFVLAASVAQVTSWRFAEEQYRKAEKDLLDRDRRFRSLIEHSSDGITLIGADGAIVYDSPSITTIMGYPAGSRIGRAAFDYIHPDDIPTATELLTELVSHGRQDVESLEIRCLHQDGSWRHIEARIKNLLDTPDIAGLVANFRDVTDRKQLERRLEHRAFHDPLTELPNRSLFLDRISHAVATQQRTREPLAVLFLDLDDFKTVNDGLGHAAGDAVLTAVGRRLLLCLRHADTCARLGGDEFGILLEGLTGPAMAYEVGARVLEALADPLEVGGSSIRLNASLGIVVSTDDEVDPTALVRNADLAMYRAKSSGKGRYEIFEAGMYDAVVERLALKDDLRRGVEAGEFVAHYQPIVELASGQVVGAEALVRWEHPERGLLPPAAFLELAEETGLIVPIGSAVLRQACRDAVAWSADGVDRSVSVNLSASQLRQDDVVEEVVAVLAETGLRPTLLTVEITETLLIGDPAGAAATLGRLKALGVSVALDDFGTGYSSLSYLSRFPVDRLKIDKSFVDSLAGAGTANDAALVAAIAGIGEMLDLQVTAEGIEEHGQLVELLALGCHFGQGYYYARAVPDGELRSLLGAPFEAGSTVPEPEPSFWAR